MALIYIVPNEQMLVGKLQLRVNQIIDDARKICPNFPRNPKSGGYGEQHAYIAYNRNSVRDAICTAAKNYSDVMILDKLCTV